MEQSCGGTTDGCLEQGDGIHPGQRGADCWAGRIKECLTNRFYHLNGNQYAGDYDGLCESGLCRNVPRGLEPCSTNADCMTWYCDLNGIKEDPVLLAFCGDGTVQGIFGEECDDGGDNGPNKPCLDDCRLAICGDGFTCDDPTCTTGPASGPEQCDLSALNSDTTPDACRTNCANPSCGDNVVDTGEVCDGTSDAACPGNCINETCQCGALAPPMYEAGSNPPFDQCEGCPSLTIPHTGDPTMKYFVLVGTKKGDQLPTGVTGMGATWAEVTNQCGARNQMGVTIWENTTTATTADPVVVDWSGGGASEQMAVLVWFSGVTDPWAGASVKFNTVGVDGSCNNSGTDTNSFANPLTTTENDSIVMAVINPRRSCGPVADPGTGWSEHFYYSVGSSSARAGIAAWTQATPAPTTVNIDGTICANTDWVVVGLEIANDVGGALTLTQALIRNIEEAWVMVQAWQERLRQTIIDLFWWLTTGNVPVQPIAGEDE
jgi:hypothetical protein